MCAKRFRMRVHFRAKDGRVADFTRLCSKLMIHMQNNTSPLTTWLVNSPEGTRTLRNMPATGASRRRFKSPYWDVPPTGYEHITPKDYKALQASGQVPQSVVNPSSQHLQGTKYARPDSDPMEAVRAAAAVINATLMSRPGAGGNYKSSTSGGGPAALTRQARRLYVGNIPFGCTDDELREFFRSNMDTCRFVKEPGNPVLACQINLDKNFAFLEFRTVEETTAAMALDGILCKGQSLKIRRPHDYQPIPGSEPTPTPVGAALSGVGALPIEAVTSAVPIQKEVLCLMNLFEPDELRDDNEYLEILEDITTECQKFGIVRSIEVPRPIGDGDTSIPGLGKAFVEFASANDAQRAQLNLGGRRFGNRIAVTSFFDLDRYRNKDF